MSVKCESCGHEHESWVPKSRLDKVAEQRDAAKAEAEARATEAAEALARATEAGASAGKLDELQARLTEYEGRAAQWDTERSAIRAGLTDDEGLRVASMLYGALEAKPEGGIAAWLSDRDALPRAVRAYLTDAPAPVADTPAAPPAAPPAAAPPAWPTSPRAPAAPPAAAPSYSTAQISAMSPEEYAAHRAQVMADMHRG